MLGVAFMKAELEFLQSESRFLDARVVVKTSSDFARLCELSETILTEHCRANPAAKQFRQGFIFDPKSRLPFAGVAGNLCRTPEWNR